MKQIVCVCVFAVMTELCLTVKRFIMKHISWLQYGITAARLAFFSFFFTKTHMVKLRPTSDHSRLETLENDCSQRSSMFGMKRIILYS